MKRKKGAIIILILVFLIGAAAFVGYKFFRVEKISVFGNEKYTQDEIIQLCGVEYETNIFMVDENEVREKFVSSPVVMFEKLIRKYPNEIQIFIRERKEKAVVAYLDAYLVVDEEIVVMDNVQAADAAEYCKIEGLQVTSFGVGSVLQADDEYKIKAASQLLTALEGTSLEIASIDVANTSSVLIRTTGGMTIKLGNLDDLENRLKKAESILEVLKQQGKNSGILDVTASNGGSYTPQ